MAEKKNKCPLCSKRLVMRDGVPTCPDCGYRDPYRTGGGQSQPNYSQSVPAGGSRQQPDYGQPSQAGGSCQQLNYGQPAPAGGSRQQSGYGQPSQTGGSRQQPEYGQPPQAGNGGGSPQVIPGAGTTDNNTGKLVTPLAVVIIALVTVVCVSMILAVVVGISSVVGDILDETARDSYQEFSTSPHASSDWESSASSSSQHGGGDVGHLTFEPPESELLQEFVSQLFDKPAASVTREELNRVIRLEIRDMYNYNGTEIEYELSDGAAGICYLSSTRVDSEDFKCFPKIQTLDLGRNYLDWDTDWHNLTSLTSLACEGTLEDLEGYMDVSQLTALDLSCDFLMRDCSGLEAYGNLEYLKLDCGDHEMELTGIAQAPSLQTLIIEDGDFITDFGELYHMPQLKELSIESKGLKDIGFISHMSGLESLELAGTELLRIDTISDRADTLKCLRLHRNFSVGDYSPVFECTGLEELELYVDYDYNTDMAMPDLSMMPGLRILALGNYERFPGLENLTALESLTLMDAGSFGNDGELTGLENLTNLKSLTLLNMSVEPGLLESFAGVDSLETINLTDTFIWGDINAVFGLPNLKVLNLDEANFGLRLEEMPVSESLLELDMTYARVHRLKEDGSWDFTTGNTQVSLGEYAEFFDHIPNLMVLKVPEQELKDVEFAANLPQLTYLDITNNHVTDLSPLAGLGQLEVIVCKNNPVNDRTGLKNVIMIE